MVDRCRAHLVHGNHQGAGNIGLLCPSSTALDDPTVTTVDVFENVRGTNPRKFNLRGLEYGLPYHCRVSAYNALGYGLVSFTVTRRPRSLMGPWRPRSGRAGRGRGNSQPRRRRS